MIRGKITYHDSRRQHRSAESTSRRSGSNGTVDPSFVTTASTCEQAAEIFLDAADVDGTYRPQGKTPGASAPHERSFVFQVFDQGEPGTSEG